MPKIAGSIRIYLCNSKFRASKQVFHNIPIYYALIIFYQFKQGNFTR